MSIGVALGHSTRSVTTLGQGKLHVVVKYTLGTIVGGAFGQFNDADKVRNRRNAARNFA